MHVVTKILVVFCAILAVLLSALTIAFSANADRLARSHSEMRQQVAAAEASLESSNAEAATERLRFDNQIKAMLSIQDRLEDRLRVVEEENTRLLAEKNRAVAEADAIRNKIDSLAVTAEVQSAVISSYRDEVLTLRDDILSANRKEIDLVDRIEDLDSVNEVLNQTVRALKEQLQELRGQNLGAEIADGSESEFTIPGPVVRARVIDTFEAPNGWSMVVINAGSNRGVRENARMNITRDGSLYVGSLVITVVEPTRAVGRVDRLASPEFSAQNDDVVLSRLD